MIHTSAFASAFFNNPKRNFADFSGHRAKQAASEQRVQGESGSGVYYRDLCRILCLERFDLYSHWSAWKGLLVCVHGRCWGSWWPFGETCRWLLVRPRECFWSELEGTSHEFWQTLSGWPTLLRSGPYLDKEILEGGGKESRCWGLNDFPDMWLSPQPYPTF